MTLLLVFAETMRRRKLSAAAEAVGLTPSAASHALVRLRALFGDELFVRRPHGVEPTARALELEPRIRNALDSLSAMLEPAAPFDPASSTRTLRLSGLDSAASLLLPDLLATVRRAAPHARLSFQPTTREAAEAALHAGDLDLSLGFFWRKSSGLETEALFEEGYGVVMRTTGRCPDELMDLETYVARDHLLVSQDGRPHGIVDAELKRLGLGRRVVATAPNFFAAMATAAQADLVLTLPRRFAARWAEPFGMTMFDPPLQIRPFAVSMTWRGRDRADPVLLWLQTQLRTVAAMVA